MFPRLEKTPGLKQSSSTASLMPSSTFLSAENAQSFEAVTSVAQTTYWAF